MAERGGAIGSRSERGAVGCASEWKWRRIYAEFSFRRGSEWAIRIAPA